MKVRGAGKKAEKIEPQMAPMIDVVFQLLIFFILTLKISSQEGDFNINMPIGQAASTPDTPPPNVIRVHLVASGDGTLGNILYMNNPLGVGEAAYEKLNGNIRDAVGFRDGKPLNEDVEVEIEADYNLHYRYTIRAVSACTGTMQKTADGELQLFRYVEKIKFAPPKPPAAAT
jgi:biopolymer transport protein ExbD